MAMEPGPRQVFPSNIVRISFPTVGGLVFFRVAQRSNGSLLPLPAARALVQGLPWGAFDLFEVVDGVVDAQGTPSGAVAIVDPVSDNMLSKYLYWAHRSRVTNDVVYATFPGIDEVNVTYARWTLVYNHVISGRETPNMLRQDAITYFQGTVVDPSLVGVIVTNNGVPFSNNEDLIAFLNLTGGTYTIEPGTPIIVRQRDDAANVILNLQKLFRDVPLVNNQRPSEVTFTIDLPVAPANVGINGARVDWFISASAWIPKLSDPVQEKQRLSFPVTDILVPISGIPGKFNPNYLMPTFPHPDEDAEFEVMFLPANIQRQVEVRIQFGAGGVPPEVEIFAAGGGGEEG